MKEQYLRNLFFKQQGLSLFSFVLGLVFVGAVVLLGFQVIPVYIENYQINKALQQLPLQKDFMNGADLVTVKMNAQKIVERQLYIDGISLPADSLTVDRQPTSYLVRIHYEKKTPLMGNVQLLIEFNDEVSVPYGAA